MKKNILRYLIFVFVSILIVGVGTYITSLRFPNMVCYSIEESGVIKDGNSLIPMARFDRLKMIAEIGKDKKINTPYYILCERTVQNGKSELEELMIVPYKRHEKYRPLTYIGNSHLREWKRIKKL